jgi:hypothetical protein
MATKAGPIKSPAPGARESACGAVYLLGKQENGNATRLSAPETIAGALLEETTGGVTLPPTVL